MILHGKAITVSVTTWDNEIILDMNHAPGAGLITRLADQQSSMLPLCYRCPLNIKIFGKSDFETIFGLQYQLTKRRLSCVSFEYFNEYV